MLQVVPDYYKEFHCIAGACRHSCCVGWEIDIDLETAERYRNLTGELGERLRAHIAWQDPPHFILGEGGRCPFLNGDNLCDLILTLGEEQLCGICSDHPRFRNELPGRVETGIGLCCEEAARLILSRREPMRLEVSGTDGVEDTILELRDEVLALLQERELPLRTRVEQMLARCGGHLPDQTAGEWAEFLLGLERLTGEWTELLELLRDKWQKIDLVGFDAFMTERQTEYEQFVVYLIYRHFANAFDEIEVGARASFAAFGYELLRMLGAALWMTQGKFSFAQQVELARLFSSELEYSEDNMDAILEELY